MLEEYASAMEIPHSSLLQRRKVATISLIVSVCVPIILLVLPPTCRAFLPDSNNILQNRPRIPTKPHCQFYGTDSNSEESKDENINLEAERQLRLESLLGVTTSNNENDDASKPSLSGDATEAVRRSLLNRPYSDWKKVLDVGKAPLLTSIGRERLETEIQLLESLAESDGAISQLWDLWYTSRGPRAAEELMATEKLVAMGNPNAWKQAEEMLRKLIAKEGLYYVEPVNRLATLLFLQDRLEESLELCLLVLNLKPWHFGALSGIVMVYQGLGDTKGMMEFAGQRMPPLPKNMEEKMQIEAQALQRSVSGKSDLDDMVVETRQTWVYRMVDQAKAALLRDEMSLDESWDLDDDVPGNISSFGGIAGITKDDNNSSTDVDDAWQ